ncbi:MAG: hypothetical protein IT426_14860 [Pirellulales bacterium]|nr:hypothetical protein [Pirellulales bacterium]
METIAPERQSEILARYQRMREMGIPLIHRVVATLDRFAIEAAARQLGMMRKNAIVLESEDESSVLMDYALHHVRQNKKTAIERYLIETPPRDRDELAWLKASQTARYRIVQVEEVYSGFGVRVRDIFRDESQTLLDVNFSRTAQPGLVLAGHLFLFEGFWITTGAGLPVTEEAAKTLFDEVIRRFGKQPQIHRQLSPPRETELATMSIRICLASGMGTRIRYADAI